MQLPRSVLTIAAACAALGHAASVGAIGCDVSEYAQYKDKAATRDGRQSLARDYCLFDDLRQIRPGTEHSATCRREMAKILDALSAAKAKTTIDYAVNGCQERPARQAKP